MDSKKARGLRQNIYNEVKSLKLDGLTCQEVGKEGLYFLHEESQRVIVLKAIVKAENFTQAEMNFQIKEYKEREQERIEREKEKLLKLEQRTKELKEKEKQLTKEIKGGKK